MLGRGAIRASVLQVRYVSAEGRIITGGGPTVKNVSGFDLPRLMVGSLGTLGLLAELIIRTNPIPAESRWFVATDADPFAARRALLAPGAILWDGTTTWIQLEGHAPDVRAELAVLQTLGSFAETDTLPTLLPHRWSLPPAALHPQAPPALHPQAPPALHPQAPPALHPQAPPALHPQAPLALHPQAPPALHPQAPPAGAFVASIGAGLLFAEHPQPPRPPAPALAELAQRIKDNFDPTGRLNPGRVPGRS
jgi:glycolate oxidase FAD binding subunit